MGGGEEEGGGKGKGKLGRYEGAKVGRVGMGKTGRKRHRASAVGSPDGENSRRGAEAQRGGRGNVLTSDLFPATAMV